MKKMFALLVCVLLVFALISCGDDPCQHRDADDNSLCDNCGESYTDGKDVDDSTPCQHRDADDNSLCDKCGESYTDGKDLADEHTHDYTVKNTDSEYLAIAANCENAATYFYSCSCGEKGTTTFTNGSANGHNYTVKSTDNKYLDKAADCENAATYYYSCSCGDKGTETFTHGSATEHSYTIKNTESKYLATAADCENAATYFYSCACGKKGTTTFTSGSANGHSYTVRSTDSKYLDKAAYCENAATYFYSCACGKKGTETFTSGSANGHSYTVKNTESKYLATAADCESAAAYYYSCSCGAKGTETFTHGDANGHSYTVKNTDSKYLDKAAYCENAATYFYSCACGKKGTETFTSGSANGHSYTVKSTDNKYLDKAADCENAATYFYSCSCGAKGTTTFTHGNANGHSYVIQNVDSKYEKTPASEYTPAVYWKSCACGKASTTETFTHGDMLPGYLTYQLSLDSSFYIVSGFVGAQSDISVPNLHDGLPVFGIMASAFKDNTTIKSITMPNSIRSIGSHAFAGCTSLESIIIPTSVTNIADHTFSGCTALKTITLHSGIDTLGAFAFEKCSALKSITLNEGLETISDNAFDFCTALESISIPDTVTSLGNMAFRHAEALRSVKFSSSLESIGNATFQYCVNLQSVELHENINTLGSSTFSYCDGLESIRILGDLTTIGTATFYECRSLTSIYFASKTPGNCGNTNYIFYNAGIEGDGITLTIAKDAVIPEGFFTPYVEDNMPKITKIVIEDGNTTVNGFKNYNKLPYLLNITYPASITDSAYGAFNNSLWWNNQEIGEVFINGIFYGYKCHCNLSTPADAVTENYVDSKCTEDGGYDTVIYCEVCNDELKRTHTVISPKGHTPKTAVEENRVEATCTEDGHYDSVVYCNRCDGEVSRETETITKLGHSPKTAVEENRVEATCTEDGHYDSVVYCNRCDEELSRQTITIPASHTPKSAVEENRVEATCTEAGSYDTVIYCEVCDDELKRTYTVIPKKGHLTDNYAISNDSQYPFNISGNQITSTNKTNNSSSTYTITAKCDFILELEYLVSSENNYDWLKIYHNSTKKVETSGTSKTTFTTISISMNVGDIVTISYSKDSSSSSGSDCAKINILTLIHQEIEENRVEATCTEDGHYDSVVYCNRCDEELSRTNKTITKLGHSPKTAVEENRVEATTCTDGHYDSVVYCDVCSDELSRQTVIIPAAHKYINGTCTECGKIVYTRDGNYIYFGEYPQTIKADSVTITSTTDSRGYYLGSDGFYYAKVVADPHDSGYTFSTGATVTDGATYYFKVEPIRWRILSEDGQSAFILCDSIIAYEEDRWGAHYSSSKIRAWLNDTFYKTAFTELQKQIIVTTKNDNSLYSTGLDSCSDICEDTEDYIFLLSYREVTTEQYGFSDNNARIFLASDYSRAIGVSANRWWLRSPIKDGYLGSFMYVLDNGYISTSTGLLQANNYYTSGYGLVPAMWIKL